MLEDKLHPLEDLLGITPGSTYQGLPPSTPEVDPSPETRTSIAVTDEATGMIVERSLAPTDEELDREERLEDITNGQKLDSIYKVAYTAFENQHRMSQEVDPKFSARNAEVAAMYLKIALDSVESKVGAQHKRAKVRIARGTLGTPRSVQNNVIVADRNTILQSLFDHAPKADEVKT